MNTLFAFSLEDGLMWLCRFVQTGAAVVLVGTGTLRLLAWSGTTAPLGAPRWNRLAMACWITLLLSAILQLGLTTAQMGDLSLVESFEGHALASVFVGTRFGAVWQVRLVLLVVLLLAGICGAVLFRRERRTASRVVDVVVLLLTVALLASLVATGHAQATDQRAWLLPTDMLHAGAAGAWPGGLLPLVILLARARCQPEWVSAATTITRRFSRLSVVAVGVLALSGTVNAYALVGTPAELWTSVYG
ncbi:MAG: hypothetical protein INR62_11040, partial [Rhodospirillales bacterium]|nr:hypothetical protein [Acetobacter sp.]